MSLPHLLIESERVDEDVSKTFLCVYIRMGMGHKVRIGVNVSHARLCFKLFYKNHTGI